MSFIRAETSGGDNRAQFSLLSSDEPPQSDLKKSIEQISSVSRSSHPFRKKITQQGEKYWTYGVYGAIVGGLAVAICLAITKRGAKDFLIRASAKLANFKNRNIDRD